MNREWICRAVIGAPHGVHGAVTLRLTTDYPERLAESAVLRVRSTSGEVGERRVEWARSHREGWLLKFEGVADRDQAAALRGAEIVEAADSLPPLPEGEYYHHQLMGLRVVTGAGLDLGRIREILRTGSADVYVTEKVLFPALREVVRRVDLEAGTVEIEPLPGLLESCGST